MVYFILNVNALKLAFAVENDMSISVSNCKKILAKSKKSLRRFVADPDR